MNTSIRFWPKRMLPPGQVRRLGHDWEVPDATHGAEEYEPRVAVPPPGDKLPETEKMRHNEFIPMNFDLAGLWFDAFALHASANLEAPSPDLISWATDKMPWLPPIEQWWLFLIHWARAFTNKRSVPIDGFYDPITGFGWKAGAKPFEKEQLTTCGNIVWVAEGVGGAGTPVWCIDARAPMPEAWKLLDKPYLLHYATVSTDIRVSTVQTPATPRGTWRVDPFGYFNGNPVPVPLFSDWEDAPTATYDGIPLRVNWFENTRILKLDDPTKIPCPYYPERDLFPAWR